MIDGRKAILWEMYDRRALVVMFSFNKDDYRKQQDCFF